MPRTCAIALAVSVLLALLIGCGQPKPTRSSPAPTKTATRQSAPAPTQHYVQPPSQPRQYPDSSRPSTSYAPPPVQQRPAIGRQRSQGNCPQGGNHVPGKVDANGRTHCANCGRFM